MKKLALAISFICYFAVTSGIVINYHYCMKRLVSVHLFETKAKVCGRCGMNMHAGEGCCKDEVKVIKLSQDQNNNLLMAFELQKISQPAITTSALICASFTNTIAEKHFHNHSPPLLFVRDLYLQNNVFRI